TLIITYDRERGEPRGARSRSADDRHLGDCVNCGICVQVCPTGIDIRNGLQYQCIGCAACVDGCDGVMDRVGSPRGLIKYSTQRARDRQLTRAQTFARALRPRVLIYAAMLGIVVLGSAILIYARVPLEGDVTCARAALERAGE